MQQRKAVGIWIRVSTEDQVRGESPEHHEKRARAYAEAKGWEVREMYRLDAMSGKSVMDYPETKRMLGHIATGHISGIIFSKLARLARNTKELLEFAEIFREHQADLISLQESIDTSSPAGRLFYTMIAAMAQWEREEIAERVAASVPIRAKMGKPLSGSAPFGYKWVDKTLVVDEKEAPLRRLIHELFLEHRRKKAVARILNDRGYRTRSGARWSDTTIERLLRDPTAKGLHRANYTTHSKGRGKGWEFKPESEWIYQEVEQILPEELWNACTRILDEQKATRKKPAKRPVHLFAGVLRCHCGEKMYVPSRSKKYTCRNKECKNRLPASDLESIFHEQLKAFVFSPEEVKKILNQANETIGEKEKLCGSFEDEAATIRSELNKIIQLYVDGELPKQSVRSHYEPLETRLKQIEDQLPVVQAEIDFLKIQILSKDEVLEETRDLYTHWQDMSHDEKRKIIETVTEQVVVGKDEVVVTLSYVPETATQWQQSPSVMLR